MGLLEGLEIILTVDPRRGYVDREILVGEVVEAPFIVRVDGVNFGERAPKRCTDHRCSDVHYSLVGGVEHVCGMLGCMFYHVVSDEASIYFSVEPFGGRVFKIISIVAGEISAYASLSIGALVSFDARIVKIYGRGDAEGYLLWRMRIGFNNYVSQLYHELYRHKAYTPPLRRMLEVLRVRGWIPSSEQGWKLTGTCGARLSAPQPRGNQLVYRRKWVRAENPRDCLSLLEKAIEEYACCIPPSTSEAVKSLREES